MIPSLPSNYVTILDLRERWLKENERNQKEKEEEEQSPPEQAQEQKVERSKPEEKHDRKLDDGEAVIQKPRLRTTSWSNKRSGQFRMVYRVVPASNPRNVNERCKKTETEGVTEPRIRRDEKEKKAKRKGHKKNPKAKNEKVDRTSRTPEENSKEEMRETECELGVQNGKDIVNERCKKTEAEGKTESLLAKPRNAENKKSRRKGRKENPRAKNEEIDRTLRTPEESLKEEMPETKCELAVQNGKKNVRAERMDEKKGIGGQCEPEEIDNMHEMKEMETKLSSISVIFEIKRRRNNSVYRGSSQGKQNFRHHQNLHRWGPHKQRNVGMIWVRKDELSECATC